VPTHILALRGATTIDADDPAEIDKRTQEMMQLLLSRNGLVADDLISILFSVTEDIRSRNPATATRMMGLSDVPLLGVQEAAMDGALPLCIRVMLHIEANGRLRSGLRHVFVHGAKVLRPDLVEPDLVESDLVESDLVESDLVEPDLAPNDRSV
jgi:chorismate mutase